jgi:hypothetical protein
MERSTHAARRNGRSRHFRIRGLEGERERPEGILSSSDKAICLCRQAANTTRRKFSNPGVADRPLAVRTIAALALQEEVGFTLPAGSKACVAFA